MTASRWILIKVQQTEYSIDKISDILQQLLQFCNDRFNELLI